MLRKRRVSSTFTQGENVMDCERFCDNRLLKFTLEQAPERVGWRQGS